MHNDTPDSLTRAYPTRANAGSGLELARSFTWADEDLQSRDITVGATSLDVARGLVGGQPAALFATVKKRNGADPLHSAALFAYHSAADWGVLADEAGVRIFNSHRLIDGEWFVLSRIGWEEVYAHTDVLSALTPDELINGTIERFASRVKAPTVILQPVDDELVQRLDSWRAEALRYSRGTTRVDEQLQLLYAQLFVLRTVEDRALDPELAVLSSITVGSEEVDWDAWYRLLSEARRRVGSDLFDEDVATLIPQHVVAGVIRDLYRPRGLPGSETRYDFSWIEADVLGTAYEKYLATTLQPAPSAAQIELFLQPEREVERMSVRKGSGAYYTPKFMRDYLATRCIDEFFRRQEEIEPPRVIDFSCGSGSFLVAAVDQILKRLKAHAPDRPWARELVQGGYVAGIDIDERAVTAARLHLWQRLAEEPDPLPLPSLSQVVIVADALDRRTWQHLDRDYDVVLGNPPFRVTSLVTSRPELEARFASARGRYDYSYLFVEQALHVLSAGGLLGLVVPNRLFINRNGVGIRRLLVEHTGLLSLVDFGSTRPFDASSYVGCIVAEKLAEGVPQPARVRVIQVRSLDPGFLAALLLRADRSMDEGTNEALRYYFARHPTSEAPWILLSESEQRSRILIEDASVRLDTIAAIPQGIRTGANDLFIFEVESEDGSHLCKALNGIGESAVLESELLEPVVYGSEVRRYDSITATKRLLYPYRNNVVLSERELEDRYPMTWAYMRRNRELLAARSSLLKSGGKWYELVWPRDEAWLRKPKLMIRDLAPRTSFAMDLNGATFLVGGTAVVPEQPELLPALLGYLNSSFIDRMLRRMTPEFRGSFQKFEPQHLQAIRVLNALIEVDGFAADLSSLSMRAVRAYSASQAANARLIEFEIDRLIGSAAVGQGIALEFDGPV